MSNSSSDEMSGTSFRSPQIRKAVLRQALVSAQALKSNVTSSTVKNLSDVVAEVDVVSQETTLEDRIREQGEVYLDSQMMTITSNVYNNCTLSLSQDISSYDYVEFAQKLVNFVCMLRDTLHVHEPNWAVMESQATKFLNRTADYSTFLGTLQPMPKKEIAKRKPIVKEAQAVTRRPENVVNLDKEEESVEETVKHIKKIISHHCKATKEPLDFFRLTLNPYNFSRTVENILHVSFLARDGMIKFGKNEGGFLVVYPSHKHEIENGKKGGKSSNIQNVVSITMLQWKALVEAYKIENPMINFTQETNKSKKTRTA